jgi:hypothetical protein
VSASLELQEVYDLNLAEGDRILSHTLVGSDAVWLLFASKSKHYIFNLILSDSGHLSVSSVPVPAERFPSEIAAVGPNKQVWGISQGLLQMDFVLVLFSKCCFCLFQDAFCVWTWAGAFVSSFDPAVGARKTNLGHYLSICAAAEQHALVASTHAVSLWDVNSRSMSHHRFVPCSQLRVLPNNMFLAISGIKMRVLALQVRFSFMLYFFFILFCLFDRISCLTSTL